MKHLQQRGCVQYVQIQPVSFEHNPLYVTGTAGSLNVYKR